MTPLDQHKSVETEAKKLQSDLDNNIRKLDRSREKFDRRQTDADTAEDHLVKAEPDSRVSRAELEKIKDVADDAKMRAARARNKVFNKLITISINRITQVPIKTLNPPMLIIGLVSVGQF